MPSIRKTKKRLKKEIARLRNERTWFNRNYTFNGEGVWDMIDNPIAKFEQELQQLKRKKDECS